MKGIIVTKGNKYFDLPNENNIIEDFSIRISDNNKYFNDKVLSENSLLEIDGYNVLSYNFQEDNVNLYKFNQEQTLVFGNELLDSFKCNKNKFYIQKGILSNIEGNIYINGQLGNEENSLYEGDLIYFNDTIINYHETSLEIYGRFTTFLSPSVIEKEELKDYPNYFKSPRIVKSKPIDPIEIKPPPSKEQGMKNKLIKLVGMPLLMAGVTVGSRMFIGGNSPFLLIMVVSTIMTTLVSIYNFFDDKKEMKIKNNIRKEKYREYLINKRKELFTEKEKQIEAAYYQNPTLEMIEKMVLNNSNRIYERDIKDEDFLDISIGYANEPLSFDVKVNIEEIKLEDDYLKEEMELISEEYNSIDNLPITINLRKSHLGLVGRHKYIKKQLIAYIMQLCFLQSYHDLEIVFLAEEKDEDFYKFMKWFNQFKFNQINASTFVCHDNQKEQVLGTLTQILKERKRFKDEKKDVLSIPHYVVIVDNPNLLINHPINEYLLEDENLAFSLIYTTNQKANLPKNIKTIINIDDEDQVRLLIKDGEFVNRKINNLKTDNISSERISRTLASIIHNKGITSNVPETVGFLEMFNVDSVEQLGINGRWNNNSPDRTLATPLGFRAENDVVELNLHEKAHGPHGLVAGTTGSGKSEIIQSYILSLAVNFSPQDVGFLLIDFKGGGMAELFKDMPHLLGSITNLDGAASYRALASINSELKRRQQLFNDNGVNNINLYTKKFKRGEATEPLPHLFLISDEFAELKKQQPEFMEELISTARIGRSLGVHLILATQKPSGVVNDQIWSNSKFKLALKVQDESDSNEIIKTTDAARITLPGRAYLQVGNNEIYELFQSAYSGAPYGSKEDEKEYDERIYKINMLGQGEVLNKDLSDKESSEDVITELDAVIKQIAQVNKEAGLTEVTKPWLPGLEEEIVNPNINNIELDGDGDLSTEIGLLDIPTEQKQIVFKYDLLTGGNLIIYGASGYGKTISLTNIILDLARKNNSKQINFDILDFGNSNLLPLKILNQTRNYVTFDTEELFIKWNKKIIEELNFRKQMFAKSGAMNYEMYNQIEEKKIPAIVVLIDNYEIMDEIAGVDSQDTIKRISRDGNSVGIYLVVTTGAINSIRYNVSSNFKTKLSLYQFDEGNYTGIVGRVKYPLKEIKGRGFINVGKVETIQNYIPFISENKINYINSLNKYIEKIILIHEKEKAQGIKMLSEFIDMEEILMEGKVSIGLDTDVDPICIKEQDLLIAGGKKSGKTNLLKVIISQLKGKKLIYGSELENSGDAESIILRNENIELKIIDFLDENEFKLKNRDSKLSEKEYLDSLDKAYLIIDKWNDLIYEKEFEFLEQIIQLSKYNVYFIVIIEGNEFKGVDPFTKYLKTIDERIIVGNIGDQNLEYLMIKNYNPSINRGIYKNNIGTTIFKIPLYKERNGNI